MIVIVQGATGSGKSLYAKAIQGVLECPLDEDVDLDCVNGYDADDDVVIVLRAGQRIKLIDLYDSGSVFDPEQEREKMHALKQEISELRGGA